MNKCGVSPDNPPEQLEGFAKLVWQLKEYGYPIAEDTVILVAEYVNHVEKPVEELDYKIVAQAIEQNTEGLEFEKRTEVKRHNLTPSPY